LEKGNQKNIAKISHCKYLHSQDCASVIGVHGIGHNEFVSCSSDYSTKWLAIK
jgi:hypothetical protein